ncbi:MAG: ATP-binding cassette domain-containing protein [Paludibacteraceae bacterium]|nr:ATP-binding cassette domain-containing protein [Paludibacteraceae bacterium]MBR6146485.1 ATP-binding cassette domain-containing protein [Paludibacteraceae bacterium]
MSVAIEHISMRIGRQQVLDDVTLHIGDGEVLGLLGPNGAGKSTLMKILVGLRQPTSGSVRVPGKAEIGYLPEQNPLYNDMFVREYLLFMARLGRVDSTRVELVIRETGLTPEVHKRIGQLSKGYRQRVGLAQALLQDPKLLILDEPTTGLDPNQLDEIRPLIRRLGQDRTVILSTHILQEVQKMCTRVVILDHGVIKADTTDLSAVEDLFRDSTSDPRPLTPDL